ncbi:conserved hypothetical protein [Leishmania braziliensis MHOM/BR/75/M2904]|uniref:Uncharacterized protein n=2 Tax=Leishmania braziliensis TaxID=5660 RepID=A4HA53_LEIBR|nr:conserved hypothetical protein [Leishmania braziliensis MHOM/BR/75/M2904]CAJ2470743.1 unnamed protein product [Leishmania braziliensis]CAM38281.1 conserved hypothetical protein [Leishmania braziliensis MHOM/BR/75/M2904]SYZ64908.1 WD_domain [Leishmania braziliensis MHOM/BR/75/M2904]
MTSVVVVSASYDKQIRLWDATSGRTVKSFVFQDSQINSLFLLPDTGYLAVAGFGALRLYDLGTFLHSGGGSGARAGSGASPGGSSSTSQAPPIYSSFESQSSMNFTSLAAVPLVHNGNNDEQSSSLSGSIHQLAESASSIIMNDRLLNTVVMTDKELREAAFLLIATSEDGHIRFFNTQSAVTLRLLKDIATGAAITCSAVSPDRRYLLTGNQMGQVSMWHLPSIVASIALDMKSHAHHKATAPNKASECSPDTPAGERSAKAGEDQSAKAAKMTTAEEERAKAFGRTPLQDINFANDYSAIRSIAIEPLGRWAAVATNAGKVHFIRLARDVSVRGSKAVTASGRRMTQGLTTGADTSKDLQLTLQERHEQRVMSPSGSLQTSPQRTYGQITAAENTSGVTPLQLALTGGIGSHGESGVASSNYHGPRETIYRSALVVNELSSNANRSSDAGGDSISGGGESEHKHSCASCGASHPNSMGAVLLDHVEKQKNSLNSRSNCPGGCTPTAHAAHHEQLAQHSAVEKLVEQLEMEVFNTIQAHYKYILRVLISPNAELLVTCSADYSVGRFLVPEALRLTSSAAPTGTKSSAPAAANAAAQPASTRPSGIGNDGEGEAESNKIDEAEVCSDTLIPSSASTQALAPTTGSHVRSGSDQPAQVQQSQLGSTTDSKTSNSSPNENATVATASGGNNSNTVAPDATVSGSTTHSLEGTPIRGFNDGVVDESLQPHMEFQPLKPLSGHSRWVWDGVFSDCSNFLFTASSDNTLRMWNGLMTERPQSVSFVGHTKPAVAVLLCYDKRRLNSV